MPIQLLLILSNPSWLLHLIKRTAYLSSVRAAEEQIIRMSVQTTTFLDMTNGIQSPIRTNVISNHPTTTML